MAKEIVNKREEYANGGGDTTLDFYVSFLEIYNEKCTDLMDKGRPEVRVREDPKIGVFIPGLVEIACATPKDVDNAIALGEGNRTVAQTAMNSKSSRSHAVITYKVVMKKKVGDDEQIIISRLNLIDLAGSERSEKTGATGDRLKEGNAINQSLSALGIVIRELGVAQAHPEKNVHVPFRSSKLTYLLRDSLTGNCKTFLTVHFSPALSNAEETISTLRFGASVKNLKTKAVVNADPKDQMVNDLRAQVQACREELQKRGIAIPESLQDATAKKPDTDDGKPKDPNSDSTATTEEVLGETMKNIDKITGSFGRKVLESRKHHEQCLADLEKRGVTLQTIAEMGGESMPFLVNVSTDPLMDNNLLYYLPVQDNKIGSSDENDIVLKGSGMLAQMCIIGHNDADQVVITPTTQDADGKTGKIMIQGRDESSLQVKEPTVLKHGDMITFGYAHLLKFENPAAVGADAHEGGLGDLYLGEELEKKLGDENGFANIIPQHAVDSLAYLMPTWKRRFGTKRAQKSADDLSDTKLIVDMISKRSVVKLQMSFDFDIFINDFKS